MLDLLNFFEENPSEPTPPSNPSIWEKLANSWPLIVIFGVIIIGFIIYTVLTQRKQKKRNEEMMSNLVIGNIVTTIGGIVGEIVQIDDKHIWLSTGTDENKTTMQFRRQAIHSVAPAPGSPEAEAEAKAEQEKADEVDEIK